MSITYGMYHNDTAHGSHGRRSAYSKELFRIEEETRALFKYHRDKRLDAERRAAIERHRAAGRIDDAEAERILALLDSEEDTDHLRATAILARLEREARRGQD